MKKKEYTITTWVIVNDVFVYCLFVHSFVYRFHSFSAKFAVCPIQVLFILALLLLLKLLLLLFTCKQIVFVLLFLLSFHHLNFLFFSIFFPVAVVIFHFYFSQKKPSIICVLLSFSFKLQQFKNIKRYVATISTWFSRFVALNISTAYKMGEREKTINW